jgi:hypothetical protein
VGREGIHETTEVRPRRRAARFVQHRYLRENRDSLGLVTCAWRNAKFGAFRRIWRSCYDCAVRELAVLLLHVVTTVVRVAGPGGVRAVVAEIRARQAAAGDPQPFSEASAKAPRHRSRVHGEILNADQHFGHRRFSSQVFAFKSLSRSSELAAVGSGSPLSGAGRDNLGDSLSRG